VQYCTGYKQDVQDFVELKTKHNLIGVLNVTQALGAFEVDASQIDFLCGSIHKWLMAGIGLSLAKIGEEYLEHLPLAGWLSQNDFFGMRNNVLDEVHEAKALELGCGPFVLVFSVGAVIKWIKENGGVKAIEERILLLVDYAKKRFSEENLSLIYNFKTANQSGILMLESKNAEQTEKDLVEKKVFVSARGKGLRVAIHYYNTEEDIENFIRAFKEVEA
jgi:cysteine desulfurase/selenocysteine lyase